MYQGITRHDTSVNREVLLTVEVIVIVSVDFWQLNSISDVLQPNLYSE